MKSALLALVFICSLPCIPLSSFPIWSGGTGVYIEGHTDTSVYSPTEYMGFELFYDPFQLSSLSPSFFAGVTGPFPPQSGDKRYGYGGIRIKLFTLEHHPFSWVSQRAVHLTPTVEASVQATADASPQINGTVVIEPLVFHFGEYAASVFGIRAIYQGASNTLGWGIRLLGFRYYLF